MNELRTSIAENGRIVIPASFRQALGIEPGEELILRLEDDELRITTPRLRLARVQKLIRQYIPAERSLVDELIAERREEAKRELE
jgi:AbrB family looped-hinge helix DNA binding protein